jgi:hypothetical protein
MSGRGGAGAAAAAGGNFCSHNSIYRTRGWGSCVVRETLLFGYIHFHGSYEHL